MASTGRRRRLDLLQAQLPWGVVSICYHPHAFDARRFAAQVDRCSTAAALAMKLIDCTVDEPDFGWSIDGTIEGDIISRRVRPDGDSVSLVEHVRSALDPTGSVVGQAESFTLLGYVSEFDDERQVEEGYLVGYLMPDEIRRAFILLSEVRFPGNPEQERDRLLLLRLFTTALKDDRGLYWTWA